MYTNLRKNKYIPQTRGNKKVFQIVCIAIHLDGDCIKKKHKYFYELNDRIIGYEPGLKL